MLAQGLLYGMHSHVVALTIAPPATFMTLQAVCQAYRNFMGGRVGCWM
jgi:hypothetical protein